MIKLLLERVKKYKNNINSKKGNNNYMFIFFEYLF